MRRPDDALLDEPEIERLARERELTKGFREAAHRALDFAWRYRREEGAAGGERERACVAQAQAWRQAVRDLHAGLAVPALPAAGERPGVARASSPPAAASSDGRKTG